MFDWVLNTPLLLVKNEETNMDGDIFMDGVQLSQG